MAFLTVTHWNSKHLNQNSKLLFFFLFLCFPFAAAAQKLLLQESFAVPNAMAAAQDVQGNLYLANPQGQVQQFGPSGKKLAAFHPDELLYINSMQALPGMQLLLFDRTSQQLHWLDRFLTKKGSYALNSDNSAGFIGAVAAAEGNSLWMVDESQQRLLKKQLPDGNLLLSVPLNLVAANAPLNVTYLREYKGKLYLYSPDTGILVFDTLGNYEKTLKVPIVSDLWLEGSRFYFITKGHLCYLDLQTNELVLIPVLDTQVNKVLVKDNIVWLLSPQEANRYLLMPATAPAAVNEK